MSSAAPGFGLGMDLPWEEGNLTQEASGRWGPSARLRNFLEASAMGFDYFFFSFQAKAFDLLFNDERIEEYFDVFDQIFALLPEGAPKALHHTFLNMATLEKDYPRERIAEITNLLVARYGLKWVNEDLGLWSLKGKMLPYPLPPVLNDLGLKACIENVSFYQERLSCPLFVEFPGFSEGSSFFIGKRNAFEFFGDVIRETGADCVLDTGHILSYQWWIGNGGERMLEGLDALLPFENCREIHLSGCSIVNGKFIDFHHGVIMDEQLVLLDFLIERCPNLIGVTYEDPILDLGGKLIAKALPNFERLRARMRDGFERPS